MAADQISETQPSQPTRAPNDSNADKSSNPPSPTSRRFTSYAHAVCGRCGHRMDGKRCSIYPDQDRHFSLSCEECDNKMLRLGRRSTQISFVSQVTATSPVSRRQSGIVVCTNSETEFTNRTGSSPVSTRFRPNISNEHERSRHKLYDSSQLKGSTTAPSQPFVQYDFDDNRRQSQPKRDKEPSPAAASQVHQAGVTPRKKHRIRVLQAVMNRISTIFGPDVQVQVTQRSLAEQRASDRDPAASVPPDGQFPPDVQSSGSGDSPPARESSQQAPASSTESGGNTSQRPTTAQPLKNIDRFDDEDEEGDPVSMRKTDAQHTGKRRRVRQDKTEPRQVVVCQCRGRDCPCAAVHIGERTVRSATNRTSLGPSMPTDQSPPASQTSLNLIRGESFRHLGEQFRAFQRPRDSATSSTSGPARSPRTSNSHPSQVFPAHIYESTPSLSDPTTGSERIRSQVLTMSGLQPTAGDIQTSIQPRLSMDQYGTAPSSPIFAEGIVEEPEQSTDPNDQRRSLRVDTNTALLRAANSPSSAETVTASNENSGLTITQRRQNEWDDIRGVRQGWETRMGG